MYIASIPNRGSPPAILLRRGYREGGKVKTETIANLSKLPPEAVDVLRQSLKGKRLVPVDEALECIDSPAHGHVEAVLCAMRRLKLPELLHAKPSPERDLAVAVIAAQILRPQSKLATTRWWHKTSLPDLLGVSDASEDDVYAAMDWLLKHQSRIQKKLAARHLRDGGMALYDLTSSYFEGVCCSLASLGHNRDGKKGKLQVNYGVLANPEGIPVAVSVFEGNTGDPTTLMPQVELIRDEFGIERIVLVGDRGMITQTQIDKLRAVEGIDWITGLRPKGIQKLLDGGQLQMGLFDERNLFELCHPDFPDERLVACRNPDLAMRRKQKRNSMIEATAEALEKVRRMVNRGRLHGKEPIGTEVDRVLSSYKLGKHFKVEIRDEDFDFKLDEKALFAELEALAKRSPDGARKRHDRAHKHIQAITKKLEKVRYRIAGGQLRGKAEIGVKVGRVIDRYKMAKHFILKITDNSFDFEVDAANVAAEAALDGIYVIRTSLPEDRISADDAVRSYKQLVRVERAFRTLKTIGLRVRPIRHHLEKRVRAHIFMVMLALYVEWHMFEAWRPLTFADEDQQAKATSDPVAPAVRSEKALRKVHSRTLEDGTEAHSFATLLEELGGIVRNECRIPCAPKDVPTIQVVTTPNPKQQRCYDLLKTITV
ncbi:MAG: transposase [Deltaproteobacteria bacterium]|nr:transposase [Deltaproteobacteria bacterium]